jgi:hypothetical protein
LGAFHSHLGVGFTAPDVAATAHNGNLYTQFVHLFDLLGNFGNDWWLNAKPSLTCQCLTADL